MRGVKRTSIQNDHKWHIWLDKWPTKCQKSKHIISKLLRRVNSSENRRNYKTSKIKFRNAKSYFSDPKIGAKCWGVIKQSPKHQAALSKDSQSFYQLSC